MIDIVTVVFQEEITTLKLQARSVELYCQNIGIKTIYVVVNDSDSVIDEIDPAWWGSLADRVQVISRRVFSTEFVDNGWLSQQLLKLLASSVSYNQWTMILDAKTIITKEVSLDQLFDHQGRLTVGYNPIAPVFAPSQQIVNRLFDIDLQHVAGPSGIPFFFHNRTVRQMINTVVEKTNQEFPRWFQDQGMLTEFILYTGYVYYRDSTLDLVYSTDKSFGVCNICHSEIGIVDDKIQYMVTADPLTVSIHRNAWKQLTLEQKNRYCDFLISKNITSARDLL